MSKIWQWDELDIHTVTNLFLYGKEDTPENYADRLRSKAEYDALPTVIIEGVPTKVLTVIIDAATFMSEGPGKYVSPSQAPVVEQFFNGLLVLPEGTYTKQQLTLPPYGISEEDFRISATQYKLDTNSPDYALRTYVFNNGLFTLSDDTEFIVSAQGAVSMDNVKIIPFDDNFDFQTNDFWANLGNYYVLESSVDPYGIGVMLDFKYENKNNIQPIDDYNYVTDLQNYSSKLGGQLYPDAYNAMQNVVSALEVAGTIEYENGNGLIIYGTAEDDVAESGTVYEDIIVTGTGHDTINGNGGHDVIYAGVGNDTITGGQGLDYIYGGAGVDTAVFSEDYAHYKILASTDHVTVQALAGLDGTDTLFDVEKLQFADGVYEYGVFRKAGLREPVANADVISVARGSTTVIDVLANDYNPDQQSVTVSLSAFPANGTATINLDGTITYVAGASYDGPVSFSYDITVNGAFSSARVDILAGDFAIIGTSGTDTLSYAQSGGDYIFGGGGNDTIYGGPGSDDLFGGAGADTIYGGTSLSYGDYIRGGDGNDILIGSNQSDSIFGDGGDDTFIGSNGNGENYSGGTGSDKYVFDMDVDTGSVSIHEWDRSGTDVIYLDNIAGGDRIEFEVTSPYNELIARFYPTSGGSSSFSFIISAGSSLAGTGVDYIVMDDVKVYSVANIINAANYETNKTFVFDIEAYESDVYPVLLSESGAAVQPLQMVDGGYSVYAEWGATQSSSRPVALDPIYHALTATGSGGSSPNGNASANVSGYLKEYRFHDGVTVDDIRLTVNNSANATLTVYVESLQASYTIENFENGHTHSGYKLVTTMSTGRASGGSSTTVANNSWTIYGDSLDFEEEQSTNTYFFERLLFSNGDAINLRGILNLEGTNAAETLYGLDRADVIWGYGGIDTINAKDGNDTIIGGAGDDSLKGGAGGDTYVWNIGDGNDTIDENNDGGHDVIQLGEGINVDDIRLVREASYNLNLFVGTERIAINYGMYSDYNPTVTGYNIEEIRFSDGSMINLQGDLTFTGTSSAETLKGRTYGNDTIYGLAGNDTITTNAGHDILVGGMGDDDLKGGAGNDTYVWNIGDGNDSIDENNDGGHDVIQLGEGINVGDVRLVRDGSYNLNVFVGAERIAINYGMYSDYKTAVTGYNIEEIRFADSSVINLQGDLTFTGTSSAETLKGRTYGNDTLLGMGGNDTLNGEAGDDVLFGGLGNDTVNGGTGNDLYVYESGLDTFYDAGGTTDRILMGGGLTINDISVANLATYNTKIVINSGANEITITSQRNGTTYQIETIEFEDGFKTDLPSYNGWLKGTSGNDLVAGSASAETLIGYAGNDTITGGDGDDKVHGGSGNDTISGGNGDDLLYGGVGNDALYGGAGIDIMHGGAGGDSFVFETASAFSNVDVIRDFSEADDDILDIANILDLAFDPLSGDIADFVSFSESSGSTFVSVDRDGTGGTYSMAQIAKLENVTGLSDADTLLTNGNLVVNI